MRHGRPWGSEGFEATARAADQAIAEAKAGANDAASPLNCGLGGDAGRSEG